MSEHWPTPLEEASQIKAPAGAVRTFTEATIRIHCSFDGVQTGYYGAMLTGHTITTSILFLNSGFGMQRAKCKLNGYTGRRGPLLSYEYAQVGAGVWGVACVGIVSP